MSSANEQEIAKRAYAIWEREGRPHGRNVEHWLTAERELNAGMSREASIDTDGASPAGQKKRTAAAPNPKPKVAVLKPKSHSRSTPVSKPH